MFHLLQMFREQLLITDYAHLHTTCVPIASLQMALGRWTADGAGQACKARAMTALFAMGDTERAKRQFAAVHPQVPTPLPPDTRTRLLTTTSVST
jgi:hypothetical protein